MALFRLFSNLRPRLRGTRSRALLVAPLNSEDDFLGSWAFKKSLPQFDRHSGTSPGVLLPRFVPRKRPHRFPSLCCPARCRCPSRAKLRPKQSLFECRCFEKVWLESKRWIESYSQKGEIGRSRSLRNHKYEPFSRPIGETHHSNALGMGSVTRSTASSRGRRALDPTRDVIRGKHENRGVSLSGKNF